MNELQVFTNKECGEIRALKRNGEAWFVAVDVCKALDINNARQAVTRLDDDEKCTVISNDGRQMNIVSESGLYSLVLSSRKKEAKTFKRWVTHDILPEIRKTGGYNPEQSEVYKTKRLEIMAMNAKARIMKEQNKRLEIMLKNNELEGLSVTAIQAILNEHPQTEKTYSATEAAEMFGVSANKIGRLANAHGLKCDKYGITVLDKAKHCDKEVQSFRYNEKGIEKLKELLREE
jgi:prophage antirepressor-like protein